MDQSAHPRDDRAGTSDRGWSWWAVLKRTVAEFRADNVTDWAAALTYYGVLSIFPALIALVSLVGLLSTSATNSLLANLKSFTPGPARDILTHAVNGLTASHRSGGILFVVGLLLAIWSASGYVGAFTRAANAVWDAPEGRPVWKTIPIRLAVTIVTLVILAAGAIAVVVTGPVASRVGSLIGLGSTAVTVWDIAKWPALVLLLGLLLSILYYAAPNVKHPGFRWVTPGGVLAIIVWIAASALFALYVATASSYNKTYGSLGGVIVFLIWLWVSNVAILLGAEFDAELERERSIQGGNPAGKEPYLPLRNEPKRQTEPEGHTQRRAT
jgi:membrane protein